MSLSTAMMLSYIIPMLYKAYNLLSTTTLQDGHWHHVIDKETEAQNI